MEANNIVFQKETFVNKKGEQEGLIRIIETLHLEKSQTELTRKILYLRTYLFFRQVLKLDYYSIIRPKDFERISVRLNDDFFDPKYFDRKTIVFDGLNRPLEFPLKVRAMDGSGRGTWFEVGGAEIEFPVDRRSREGLRSGKTFERCYNRLSGGNYRIPIGGATSDQTMFILYLLLKLPPAHDHVREILTTRKEINNWQSKLR
ncbi:MAG: hypothetical protein AAF998_06810 [Bacteroidota bacterium]